MHRAWLGRVLQGCGLSLAFGLGYALLRLLHDQFLGNGTQDWLPLAAAIQHLVDGPILEETLFRLVLLSSLLLLS